MKPETKQELERVKPMSFYQRADAVIRLFENEDVGDVLGALDQDFRNEFIEFGRTAYATGAEGDERLVIGNPVPAPCLAAFRAWLRKVDALEPARSAFEGVARKLSTPKTSSPPSGFIPGAPAFLGFFDRAPRGGALPREKR
jgi:hypothetical protein